MKRLLALVAALSVIAPLIGDDLADVRAQAGARLFRAFLSADVDVDRKKVEKDQILVVFLYTDDRQRAADLAASSAGFPSKPRCAPTSISPRSTRRTSPSSRSSSR